MSSTAPTTGAVRKRASLLGRVSSWWHGGNGKRADAKGGKPTRPRTVDVPPPQQPVHWWDIEQKVWGEGFSDPVSGPFLTALIKPLEPESYSELLLLGAGFGGAASEIVSRHGAKVAAHEAVTELAEAATAHWAASAMEKPPAIEPCDLAVATLPSRTFDGGLALNAFLPVGDKAGALKRIEQALKLRKRLVILEAFADEDIDPKSEVFQAWRDAEPTPVHLMSYSDFEAVLQETGFTLLDQKDLTAAYQDLITGGWAKAMRTLRPPTDGSVDADAFVECVMRQCRRWTLLSTLLKEEKLRIYLVNAQVGESAKLMSDW